MMNINSYLDNVFQDFQSWINEGQKLCFLRDVRFSADYIPKNYDNIHIQQYYLLRYAYGYAYEYKLMYRWLFQQSEKSIPFGDKVRVCSIGCGSRLDYWGLHRALRTCGYPTTTIHYRGLDIVDWNYKIPTHVGDNVRTCHTDAVSWFERQDELQQDVFIFPKSISEFDNSQIQKLCGIFQSRPIKRNRVYLLATIRTYPSNQLQDNTSVDYLRKAITNNGFTVTLDTSCLSFNDDNRDKSIREEDSDFVHPKQVVDTLLSLNKKCAHYYDEDTEDCDHSCDKYLTRFPILKVREVCFRIIIFDRK